MGRQLDQTGLDLRSDENLSGFENKLPRCYALTTIFIESSNRMVRAAISAEMIDDITRPMKFDLMVAAAIPGADI